MQQIFISYSRDDYEVAELFYDYLKNLEEDRDDISVFMDVERIKPGDRWKDIILPALEQSSVFICLYSRTFFKSRFIRTTELPAIAQRYEAGQCKVFGFLLDSFPCDNIKIGNTSISDLQLLGPNDGNQRIQAFNLIKDDGERELQIRLAYDEVTKATAMHHATGASSGVTPPRATPGVAVDMDRCDLQIARLDRSKVWEALRDMERYPPSVITVQCQREDWPEGLSLRIKHDRELLPGIRVRCREVTWPNLRKQDEAFAWDIWERLFNQQDKNTRLKEFGDNPHDATGKALQYLFKEGSHLVVNYKLDLEDCSGYKKHQLAQLCDAWQEHIKQIPQSNVTLLFTFIASNKTLASLRNWNTRATACKQINKSFGEKVSHITALEPIAAKHVNDWDCIDQAAIGEWPRRRMQWKQELFEGEKLWRHESLRDALATRDDFVALFPG